MTGDCSVAFHNGDSAPLRMGVFAEPLSVTG
jgi:hypothetical protein